MMRYAVLVLVVGLTCCVSDGVCGGRSLGLGSGGALVAGSNLETGGSWGSSGGLSVSGVYYDDQFVFRSAVTAVPGDSSTCSELLMGWVFGKDPWKARLCLMGGGMVRESGGRGSLGLSVAIGGMVSVEEGTLLYPNFTVVYMPWTHELVFEGRVEVVFHVLKAWVGGAGDGSLFRGGAARRGGLLERSSSRLFGGGV